MMSGAGSFNSFGQTAEEIEEQLQKLEADAAASGLRPPRRDVEYHPMKSTTRYIYETVEFDAPVLYRIVPATQRRKLSGVSSQIRQLRRQ